MSTVPAFIWRSQIFHNRLNDFPLSVQHLDGNAVDGSWGAFTSNDDLEDLAVTDPNNPNGPAIRLYGNRGDGSLEDQGFYTFADGQDYKAQQIVFAQINGKYEDPTASNKLDLVGIDGTKIKIWRNDNSNDLPNYEPYRQFIDLYIGTITSLVVADINNDGYNDILVGTMLGARAFFNSANTNGDIHTQAYWGTGNITGKHLVAVGDIGSPGTGGQNRLDGWNDLVVASANNDGNVTFKVFINQQGVGGVYFTASPQQTVVDQSPGPAEEEGAAPCNPDAPLAVQLADVKTNGGLSIVYRTLCNNDKIFMLHNSANPAPAPPKNVKVEATPPNQYGYSYPKLSWTLNTERDLHPQAAYDIWRTTSGANCGASNWYHIASLGPTVSEFTDWSIGTVMPGGDCVARYRLTAKDNQNNVSDTSKNVQINFASYIWKATNLNQDKPASFALHPAYPNPFNPSTEFRFDLPEPGFVSLVVYDVLGRKVANVAGGYREAGYHSVTWNAVGQASGVYYAWFTISVAEVASATHASRSMYSKFNKLILLR